VALTISPRRVAAGVLVVLAVATTAIWAKRHWDTSGGIEVTLRGAHLPVDEMTAVRATRDALASAAIQVDLFEPVPFLHDSSLLFARNSQDAGAGYVLWRAIGSDRQWDYRVRCEWRTERTTCRIMRGR
jgi:hypothetical protein